MGGIGGALQTTQTTNHDYRFFIMGSPFPSWGCAIDRAFFQSLGLRRCRVVGSEQCAELQFQPKVVYTFFLLHCIIWALNSFGLLVSLLRSCFVCLLSAFFSRYLFWRLAWWWFFFNRDLDLIFQKARERKKENIQSTEASLLSSAGRRRRWIVKRVGGYGPRRGDRKSVV